MTDRERIERFSGSDRNHRAAALLKPAWLRISAVPIAGGAFLRIVWCRTAVAIKLAPIAGTRLLVNAVFRPALRLIGAAIAPRFTVEARRALRIAFSAAAVIAALLVRVRLVDAIGRRCRFGSRLVIRSINARAAVRAIGERPTVICAIAVG
jgi:hypothetical protein